MAVVAHNLISQFTNRQLNMTTNNKAKSSEKLASGYRINRSADDAAGLQISEKMRSQIRGLNQASRNIQDGISLCQVADGALNETHAVLQRMRELSVQAANDTNTDADRDALSQEINQLAGEVDRIANTTNFNNAIYPLRGTASQDQPSLPYVFEEMECIVSINMGATVTVDGTTYVNNSATDVMKVSATCIAWKSQTSNMAVYFAKDKPAYIAGPTDVFGGHTSYFMTQGEYGSLKKADLKVDDQGYVYYDLFNLANGSRAYFNTKNKTDPIYDTPTPFCVNIYGDPNKSWTGESVSTYKIGNSSDVWIQSGALANQGIKLDLVNATCKGIGLKTPVDVSSFDAAGDAMTNIDEAIGAVSNYRSTFGAQQNRLEHAMAVDDNTAENTQYSESRIRDTDMAEQMVAYSKSNILEQVGQSMLAQANQSNQGILSLLG